MLDLSLALKTALLAAKKADELFREHAVKKQDTNHLSIKTKANPHDYVTMVDGLVQEAIVSTIHEVFPDHRFLAEEEGADNMGDPSSPFVWVIDPLDGTLTFIHGKPIAGTLLSLQENDTTLLAILSQPFLNRLFQATTDSPTLLNSSPVQLRPTRNLHDSILSSNPQETEKGTLRIETPIAASLENYGCAAEAFAQLLMGHNNGILYNGPRLWDTAAGSFLTQRAGGKARLELVDANDPRGPVKCVASTKESDEYCRCMLRRGQLSGGVYESCEP